MLMEKEEEEEAPPPPLLRPTPDHPPYSEMVQCAIRSLAEPHGSMEPSISSYIEAHYDSLPWAHSKLLPYYLNKLVLAREIAKSPLFPDRYVLPRTRGRTNPRNPRSSAKRRRGRPKKVIPCNADGEDEDGAKFIASPNPKLEIVRRGPAVKPGRGRPRKITPHVDGEPNSEPIQKGSGNGPELIVNPSPHPNPNAEILLRDPIIKCDRGRPWMLALHAHVEPNSEPAGKGSGNGHGLVVNTSPNPDSEILHHHSTIKGGREQPQKIACHADGELNSESLEKDGVNRCSLIANLNPEILRHDGEAKCGPVEKGSANRANLNVNPNPNLDHDPISLFMEPELNSSGERPRLVLKLKRRKPEEVGGDGGDGTGGWMCLKEERIEEEESESVKVDGGDEKMMALQEKDLNAVEVDEHFEELLALQEKGASGIKIDQQDEGFLALQEKDLDWMQIETDGQNEGTLPLEGIKVLEHNEGLLLPLQVEKESNGIDGDNEERLVVQGEEKDLEGTKVDEHNEELLVPKVVLDAKSSKSKSDQWPLHKKAKPKKTRRLWYEG